DLALALAPPSGAEGVGHARFDMAGEQQLLDLIERALHRGDLEEGVHAVGVVTDHALQPLHLALDAAPSAQRLRFGGVVEHPGTLRGYFASVRAACQRIAGGSVVDGRWWCSRTRRRGGVAVGA